MQDLQVPIPDRIISALTYLTAGWGGVIYSILMFLAKKKIGRFTKFNIFQSIMISVLFFFGALIVGFVMKILSYIPLIDRLVVQLTFLFNRPFFLGYSIIQTVVTGVVLYAVIYSLLGKYPKIYWISSLIDRQA